MTYRTYRADVMRIFNALVIVFITVCGSANASEEKTVERRMPRGVHVERDVVYGKAGDKELKLDIYRPEKPPREPVPCIVFIHGGGWMGGSKDGMAPMLAPLARKGYAGVSINYRLTGEAQFPAQIHDCKTAVRFLRANAKEYNIDPDRIGVWGTSAGGHLASLLGLTGDVAELEGDGDWKEQSSKVQAVCNWFGPSDIVKAFNEAIEAGLNPKMNPVSRLIGGTLEEKREVAMLASPVTHITKDAPPFLIMHGADDRVVSPEHSEILHERLTEKGVESTLIIIEGEGHAFRDAKYHKDVHDFFDKHLKK